MKGRGSGQHHYDLSRCKEAYELFMRGFMYYQIAKIMGVNATRASIMVERWRQELLLQETITDLMEYRNMPKCR